MAKKKKKAPNPRQAQPGTSYTASGLLPPDISPEQGSSSSPIIQEIVPELSSPFQRAQIYSRMMHDAGVNVSVRIWKTPILGAEMFVEPASQSPDDILIAEFVEDNLFAGMNTPFQNSIEDILHMCEDGFSILYKVYENRNWAPAATGSNGKTYTMLKKLAYRAPGTVSDIEYDDNGGVQQVTQNAIKADGTTQEVKMPINKLLIFTLNKKGGDVRGSSVLRSAYPHWYYKTHLYKIDAIQKERHGIGVPRGHLAPGYTAKDVSAMRQMLRNLRTNEEAFMLLTPNVEMDFAELVGQPVDVMQSAEHHNVMILMNVMAQFMTLGVGTSGGGRATAGAQTDIFIKSLKTVANYIVDQFNMFLIPELVVWNFKTTNFPQLKVRNIGDTRDLQMLGSAISNLFAQSAITGDEDTENWIRSVFDMPSKAAGTRPTEEQLNPSTTANQNGNTAQKGATKNPRDKVGGNVGKPPAAAQ